VSRSSVVEVKRDGSGLLTTTYDEDGKVCLSIKDINQRVVIDIYDEATDTFVTYRNHQMKEAFDQQLGEGWENFMNKKSDRIIN